MIQIPRSASNDAHGECIFDSQIFFGPLVGILVTQGPRFGTLVVKGARHLLGLVGAVLHSLVPQWAIDVGGGAPSETLNVHAARIPNILVFLELLLVKFDCCRYLLIFSETG